MDPRESADLERRVQAHEELLTALIAAVAKEHPAILSGLEAAFSKNGDTAGHPDAVDHAGQVLRTARRLVGAN